MEQECITFTIDKQKRIALIAHDGKKHELMEWCETHKDMCEYLGIGQTKARELLSNPANGFTVRIGNRLYAHKGRLDHWLLNQILS